MAVDDLWFLKKRDENDKRVKSKLHGKGKRYRVRYEDTTGTGRTKFFHKKGDADDFDLAARAGTAPEVKLDQAEKRVIFGDYAERWRVSRGIGHSLEYRDHVRSCISNHLTSYFGPRPVRSITVTDVMEWIASMLTAGAAQGSVQTRFNLLNAILNAAVADKVISDNPCKAVRLSVVLRGLSKAPKWVPTDAQVLALLAVVPDRYLAAIWLGVGQGTRLGEALGIENGTRCVDFLGPELHVVQQLRFNLAEFGGFYLGPPKSGSVGTVDLDDQVALVLAEHIRKYPPVAIELPDISEGTPDPGKPVKRRPVELLFTNERGQPIRDQRWSELWAEWRKAAGWPGEGTFHSLRHFFGTTLITEGADPTEVQNALRHRKLRTTLETYVHWWPKTERRRSVISAVLSEAADRRSAEATGT